MTGRLTIEYIQERLDSTEHRSLLIPGLTNKWEQFNMFAHHFIKVGYEVEIKEYCYCGIGMLMMTISEPIVVLS